MKNEHVKELVKTYIKEAGVKVGESIPQQAVAAQHSGWDKITADQLNAAIDDLVEDGEIEITATGQIRRLK